MEQFHAAAIETTRALVQTVQPGLMAVCIGNDSRDGLEEGLQERANLAKGKEDVQRIVDGYVRVASGAQFAGLLAYGDLLPPLHLCC